MRTPLPTNEILLELSQAMPWQEIEQQKRRFNQAVETLARDTAQTALTLDKLSEAVGAPVTTYYDAGPQSANVFLGEINGRQHVLGSAVSARYRGEKTLAQSIVPYNFNPSVNHTNLDSTDDPSIKVRSMGAEVELGLVHRDGSSPTETQIQEFTRLYQAHAQRLGISPHVDREACQYQMEVHVAPVIGYAKTREALRGILTALAFTSKETGLLTTLLPAYPTLSDFKLSEDLKVQTAVDLMLEVNGYFPEYAQRLAAAQARYHIPTDNCNHVQIFRNHGCHIHLDLAGRSEALGLLTFYTMLRSASAVANSAVLKGSPFVNGTCDPELLCTREYMRQTTVTGHYIDLPTSPHLSENGLEIYSELLRSERVNAPARAMLYTAAPGEAISAMHNPIGRVRPDMRNPKRICTVESTGMPASISASRMGAVLADFEFNHVLIEAYFRRHGCDLEAMYNDREMWAILGPLDSETFIRLQDESDHECTDMTLVTATGEQMTLAEFYEKKRVFMHKALMNLEYVEITPRDIDDVYVSLSRMLAPPSGRSAQTILEFVSDPRLKSTGNWGRILQNAFIEAGGTPGEHRPDIVLNIVQQIHDALLARYLYQ